MIYFTSDQHFGHENIIKHCNRPFKSVEEMDEAMVHEWNQVVRPKDMVYHLGDISHKRCSAERADHLISRLNGHKLLIVGNHEIDGDPDRSKHFKSRLKIARNNFISVNEGYHEIEVYGKLVVMSHYALETWHGSNDKSIHLHGHSHGKLGKKTRRLDVGVDTHAFRPWSAIEVFEKLKIHTPAFLEAQDASAPHEQMSLL